MNREPDIQSLDLPIAQTLARIEETVQCRLSGRVRNMELLLSEGGLVLRGRARTYYAKQLAQHAVMEVSDFPILANEIEVS
jgi:hypothetical protein